AQSRPRIRQRAVHGPAAMGLLREEPARRPAAEGVSDARAAGAARDAAVTMSSATPPKTFTHGTILRWRRVPGLVLAEVEYEPGRRIPRHVHPHARLVLVLSGSVAEIRSIRGAGAPGVNDDSATHSASTLLFRR